VAQFGESRYTCDRAATLAAYRQAEAGGSSTCDCAGCRNFVAARDRVFPEEFLLFLDSLGIDPTKDGEVYHVARRTPGFHYYGGWYHFVGVLELTGDFPPVDFGGGFSSHMCLASAPRLDALQGLKVVQLCFNADSVPWVLDEPELD